MLVDNRAGYITRNYKCDARRNDFYIQLFIVPRRESKSIESNIIMIRIGTLPIQFGPQKLFRTNCQAQDNRSKFLSFAFFLLAVSKKRRKNEE